MSIHSINLLKVVRQSNTGTIFSRNFALHVVGKHPKESRSLQDRIAAHSKYDPEVNFKVNIGYPDKRAKRSDVLSDRIKFIKTFRSNPEIEKLARHGKLQVDIEEIKKDSWNTIGPQQLKNIAEHYGVFEHLFGDAYFTPITKLNINYSINNDTTLIPVFTGNIIKPSEASSAPEVNYESKSDTFYTLVLTNPDGHFTQENSEYVHWFIGNIPGSDISKGDLIFDYLQPFPAHGIGYQRMIFILYQQTKKLDYSSLTKPKPCLNLKERTFNTYEFYKAMQDFITPAGLAFYQTNWDKSLTDFFHNVLKMREPSFEYDFPPPFLSKQKWFPLKQPFNVYLDKHRDQKQIAKEFLLRRLKKEHPFKAPQVGLKFPNAIPLPRDKYPSWLVTELKKSRSGKGRINDY